MGLAHGRDANTMHGMEQDHARAIAERLHADDHALLEHIRRVVLATPAEGCAVAWLHEAHDAGAVSEHDLLREGLRDDELRALRLLTLPCRAASDAAYLAHLDLIARAAGRSGRLARMVMTADLIDRSVHPWAGPGQWTPPYERGLALLPGSGDVSVRWRR